MGIQRRVCARGSGPFDGNVYLCGPRTACRHLPGYPLDASNSTGQHEQEHRFRQVSQKRGAEIQSNSPELYGRGCGNILGMIRDEARED
jgi:hypothetical protein